MKSMYALETTWKQQRRAGYKDTHTLRNQACKLRREFADEISDELHRNFAEIAPRALNILSDLAENAESESSNIAKETPWRWLN